ncbi:MAG: hydantoinase/oxoprolinase family protein [Deltaproteobacteria bacterium]|jgi:N-methylhydantoinase A/oxoprolinase/acetone carboxylase beta subunit|nr:hydantoinase/oxoprolinase family protein [Deltaproteobacteria bacterium]
MSITFDFNKRASHTGPLVLGLDTGGTNTDVVLYETETQSIVASAKDFTTHHDLSIGIRGALKRLIELLPNKGMLERVKSVNLSTTLATNAIAEGLGHRVGLVMVGFDEKQDIVQDLIQRLPACSPIFIRGGHNYYGQEMAPLDEETLVTELERVNPEVKAWAVSSFFSVKNPVHELRVEELIRKLSPDATITLGQNLTGELGAVRRAATAALNAGLVLIIQRLMSAVLQSLKDLGIRAPLMVVKGDGGLVSEAWARVRPIETVVSGPAAGVTGAGILARGFLDPDEKNLWVLDVGGTTSDLAYLEDGHPRTNPNGAVVGNWITMVEAVETTTRGLGGDSLVDFTEEKEMILGPRRVLPLCRLAEAYPNVIDLLSPGPGRLMPSTLCRFFTPNLDPDSGMNDYEKEIRDLLVTHNPLTFAEYQNQCLYNGHLFPGLKFLTHPSILVSAFTPTDAFCVLGLFKTGVPEASMKAAYLLGMTVSMTAEELSRAVLNKMGKEMAEMLVRQALVVDEVKASDKDFKYRGIFEKALGGAHDGALNMDLSLNAPVVIMGAPAAVLSPWAQKFLGARILTPPRFEVASATGAAASTISLIRRVDIVSLPDLKTYRAFLPDRLLDGANLNTLVSDASVIMGRYMLEQAKLAGADENSPVSFTRSDRQVLTADGIYFPMGCTLKFTLGYTKGEEITGL